MNLAEVARKIEETRAWSKKHPSYATQALIAIDSNTIQPIVDKTRASEREILAGRSVLYSSLPPGELADFIEKRSGEKILP